MNDSSNSQKRSETISTSDTQPRSPSRIIATPTERPLHSREVGVVLLLTNQAEFTGYPRPYLVLFVVRDSAVSGVPRASKKMNDHPWEVQDLGSGSFGMVKLFVNKVRGCLHVVMQRY